MWFAAETEGIVVRAQPQFLDRESDPGRGRFVWAYTIEVDNQSDRTVQLVARTWLITDDSGLTQTVRGEGVVGETPVLAPGERFRYISRCPLNEPAGVMVGSYQMRDCTSGARFDIAVPAFPLDSPYIERKAT